MAKSESSSTAEDDRKVFEEQVIGFLKHTGFGETIPESKETKYFYSEFVAGILKVDRVQRGKISCFLTVKPLVKIKIGALGLRCDDLRWAAPMNAELLVEASVVRSGRNLTVVAVEFRPKNKGKQIYTARCTFYHMQPSKL